MLIGLLLVVWLPGGVRSLSCPLTTSYVSLTNSAPRERGSEIFVLLEAGILVKNLYAVQPVCNLPVLIDPRDVSGVSSITSH